MDNAGRQLDSPVESVPACGPSSRQGADGECSCKGKPALAVARATRESQDYSHEFIEGILTNVERSRARRRHLIHRVDPSAGCVSEIQKRFDLYRETGKRDFLIDVAEFCMRAWIKHGDRMEVPA